MSEANVPGKLILFGEHAVVYDKLGVSTSVGLYSSAAARALSQPADKYTIDLPDLNVKKEMTYDQLRKLSARFDEYCAAKDYAALVQLSKQDDILAELVLAKGVERCGMSTPIMITAKSMIPVNSGGMGSSSAIGAAMAASILSLHGNITLEDIERICYYGDTLMHGGMPSGIDSSTVTYGGYVQFRKSVGLRPLRIDTALPIVIGNTGKKAQTSKTVALVRQQREDNQHKIDRVLDEIDKTASLGLGAVQKGDLKSVGSLMDRNHTLLSSLGVSEESLDNLVNVSRSAGALGAKLTGGGGGGAMIALCSDQRQQLRVAEAMMDCGYQAIMAVTGVPGAQMRGWKNGF